MSRQKAFYVLGAGASYDLAPVTNGLSSIIAKEYKNIGIYPVSQNQTLENPILERIFEDSNNYPEDGSDVDVKDIPAATLDLLLQHAFCVPIKKVVPSQYGIFDFICKPSTIFSYNHDGLASAYCSDKHYIFEPHGRVDRLWIESGNYAKLLKGTVAYDLVLPHLTPKLFLSPEPSCITETEPYIFARKLFMHAPALIIIGYSFSQVKGKFDDAESLEYFVDLLKYCPKPVVILSPNPYELVEILQYRLSSLNVFGLPIQWEVFSVSLLNILKINKYQFPLCNEQIKELERMYYFYYNLSQKTR